VDNDPGVLAHAYTLLAQRSRRRDRLFPRDPRDPEKILASPVVTGTLDLRRPVALILVAVLPCLRPPATPRPLPA
jgi:hypothetical protein